MTVRGNGKPPGRVGGDELSIREIATMLAERILPLCQELLPLGHREAHEWVEARRAKGGLGDSMKIHLGGQKRGVWCHFAAGRGGDALDLIGYVLGLDKRQAIEWARRWLGLDDKDSKAKPRRQSSRQPPKTSQADAAWRIEAARRIWRQARPAAGTLVETYLRSRTIRLLLPPTIRYAPALKHTPTGLHLPAMVCAIQAPDRSVVGVHRIFLKMSGEGKAPVSHPKLSLGTLKGGAVRLDQVGSELAITEGLETGLSVLQATGKPTWACLSAPGLQAVILPPLPLAEIVFIAADNDPAGMVAARKAATRFVREGRKARIVAPPEPGADWNDAITRAASP